MIFAFMDGGGLAIHSSIEEVRRAHEAIDVENEDVVFYDEDGRRLLPLRILDWDDQGELEVQDSGEDHGESRDQMLLRLAETTYLKPNKFFRSLDEVRAHLHRH